MSNGLMHKFKNWISGDPFEDDIYNLEEEFEAEGRAYHNHALGEELDAPQKKQKANLKVVGKSGAQATQVVVIEPKAFEESLEIIEHLRTRRSVILNLHLLDTAASQRVVDFLSGATHAIDGNQQRIGDGVFMFTPSNVSISTELETEMPTEEAYWGLPRA